MTTSQDGSGSQTLGPEELLLKQSPPSTSTTLPELPFPAALLAVGDSVRMPQFRAVPSAQTPGSSVFLPTWISLWEEERQWSRAHGRGWERDVDADGE